MKSPKSSTPPVLAVCVTASIARGIVAFAKRCAEAAATLNIFKRGVNKLTD